MTLEGCSGGESLFTPQINQLSWQSERSSNSCFGWPASTDLSAVNYNLQGEVSSLMVNLIIFISIFWKAGSMIPKLSEMLNAAKTMLIFAKERLFSPALMSGPFRYTFSETLEL